MPLRDHRALLRLEVGRLRARESRRVFDLALNVGTLAGARRAAVVARQDQPALDAALRAEIVLSLLAQQTWQDDAVAWVVRPGRPELHDSDLGWLSALALGFGVHGRRLEAFYAVTRAGWLDVCSGESRSWKRLRL
jgi:hypothetical protein